MNPTPENSLRGAAGRPPLRTRALAVAVAACLVATLAACGGRDDAKTSQSSGADASSSASNGFIHIDPLSFSNDGVRISRAGGPDALVAADGTFKVDGLAVSITPDQRALFKQYYDAAYLMRSHALETGLAGAAVAKTAVGEVLGGLLQGDTSQIEKNVKASAEGVKQAALKLCGDLEAIGGIEKSLAGFEPFAPYRFVDDAKVADCRRETATAGTPESAPPATPGAPPAPATPGAPSAPAAPAAPTAGTAATTAG